MNKTVQITLYEDHEKQTREWIEIAKKTHEAKQLAKYYKQEEQKLLDQLKALSNNKNAKGGEFVFTMSERPGAIEYKNIPELKDVDLDLYRKETVSCWKLIKI